MFIIAGNFLLDSNLLDVVTPGRPEDIQEDPVRALSWTGELSRQFTVEKRQISVIGGNIEFLTQFKPENK